MGMLTKFGTLWGRFPQTPGRMFFVGPGSSTVSSVSVDGRSYPMSDGNDGLSPERPLSTIARALALVTANVGDMIILLPGTHNLTTQPGQTAAAALAFNVAGVTVIGLPYDDSNSHFAISPQAIITAPASTVSAVLTAADITFLNVGFLAVTGQKTVTYTTACNRTTFRGCYFDLTVGNASTVGIAGTGSTQTPGKLLVEDCIFEVDNTGTSGGACVDTSAAKSFLVRNNRFRFSAQGAAVTTYTTFMQVNAGSVGTIDNNWFVGELSATAAATSAVLGVSMTANGTLHLYRNIVSAIVTTPFKGFAGGDCDLCLNYVGTIAGGTGGTLITSTT